ncbi:MAG: Gfo/Idh/MocA family protein, partial [Solirubrobacteraceae bacterium]
VDLLRMLAGEIVEAKGLCGHQLGFETEDTSAAALAFESGALGTLTVSVNVWRRDTRVEIVGTEGAVMAEGASVNDPGRVMLMQPRSEPRELPVERPSAWARQLDSVTRAACGEELPYATGEDGARNLEILEQIAP